MASGTRNEFPDERLIKGFLEGESSDFNILYERYKRQLYSYLNRLVPGQGALVDDIFQQTWIKIINQLPKYKNKERFLAWIMRISHNLAIDHFRRSKYADMSVPIDEKQDLLSDDYGEPWKDIDREALEKALDWALEQLTPELKEVFILRQDDLSFKEIAEIQQCSINTALGRMQYALKNLQGLLKDWHKRSNLK